MQRGTGNFLAGFMTFLNPLVLLGLAAAAIPIIIHLLNLRKLKTVEFSSLRFLKELQRTKMRRLKIRQLLLLILRTLIIIAVVLAFSRPAIKGTIAGSMGSQAKTTIIILLDDSPTMALRNERGVLFAQAKTAVGKLLDLARDGDEIHLVKLSEIPHRDQFTPGLSLAALKSALEEMTPSQQRTSFRDALGVAARIAGESRNFNREVYLVTDGQATQFPPAGGAPDTTDLFDDDVRIFLLETWSEQLDNTAVASVRIRSRILSKDKPAAIEAIVRNVGAAPLRNSVMSVYLDGSRVVQQSLDIAAEGSSIAGVSVIPKRWGALRGSVQLEDDRLEIDNTRYFVVPVPEQVTVLLVGPSDLDTRLPALALTASNDTTAAGLYTLQQIPESRLSSTDINKFDVLIMCGVKDFSVTEADILSQFVRSGGGLMLFPGRESNISNYNEVLLTRLGIPAVQPAIVPTTDHASGSDDIRSFLSFDKVDLSHPLFAGMFETAGKPGSPSVESPRVFSAVSLNAGQNGHAIITLSNGSGFLVEYPVTTGRVLVFSVEAGLTWSDFPVKGLFAPLLHRSVLYLAVPSADGPANDEDAASFIVGQTVRLTLRLKSASDRDAYSIMWPSGSEERVVPRFLATAGLATFDLQNPSEAGIYELRQRRSGDRDDKAAPGTLRLFAVNVDPVESDLKRIDNATLATFWEAIGVKEEQIQRIPADARIDAVVTEARFGVELWKYFVILAILLAVAEMIIGRVPRSQAVTGGEGRT